MKLPIYHIDAFTDKLFSGNPAAVCPLEAWLPDALMQSIAAENNLSETAFFIPTCQGFHLRWFTPTCEVELCGHATLAAAYVLFHCLDYRKTTIAFASKSGTLTVTKKNDLLVMNFPAQPPSPCPLPATLKKAFKTQPLEGFIACLKAEDYLLVFDNEAQVIAAQPNFSALLALDLRGVIITAPSYHCDFVSRFFAPKYGINEDPVTGSAHTQLAPYWSKKLGISKLHAKQLSARGGDVFCDMQETRVLIAGQAVKYMQGEVCI